jgi:hypothetical protein
MLKPRQSPYTYDGIVERSRGIAGMNLQSKFRGAMLGLAVGDAVGTTLEFKSPGSFKKIDDMVGGVT